MDLAALLSIEVGKNRLEAIGDVEETADLIRWSCDLMEANDGFDREMGNLGDPQVRTRSVLKPFGVWAADQPFTSTFLRAARGSGAALAVKQHRGLPSRARMPLWQASASPTPCARPASRTVPSIS